MKTARLGDICHIKSGGTPRRNNTSFYGGNILWAKIGDIDKANGGVIYDTQEKITEKGLNSINNKVFDEGTLLLAMYGSVGKVAIAGTKLSTNQAILGINPKKKNILDLSYLKYWIFNQKHVLEHQARGGILKNLSAGMVKNLIIPLPPLETQRQIAYVLDKADAVRQKRRGSVELLDKLLRDSYQNFFGEKEYKFKKLSELCHFITKGTTPKNTNIYNTLDNDRIPFLKVYHLNNGRIDLDYKPQFIDVSIHNSKLKRSKVFPNDVLMNIVGPPLGKFGLVTETYLEYNINQAIVIFRPKKQIKASYLLYTLMHPPQLQRLLRQAIGVRQLNLSLRQCRDFKIPLAPMEEQIKFEKFYFSMIKYRKILENSLLEAENLFNSLLQRAFKGELEIDKDVYDVMTTGTINPNQDKESVNAVTRMIESFEAVQQQLKQQGAILSQSLRQVSKQMQRLSDEWTKTINTVTKQSSISAVVEQLRTVGGQLDKEHFKTYYAFSDKIKAAFPNLETTLKELNKPMNKEQIQTLIHQTFEEKSEFSFEDLNNATENFNVEYDTLKEYLFESVENGTIEQVFEIDDNRTLGDTGTDKSQIKFKLIKTTEA